MKKTIYSLMAFLLLSSFAVADNTETRFPGATDIDFRASGLNCDWDNISINIDGDDIIMTNRRQGDKVEITHEYDLIINGKTIEMDDRQRELVKDFYHNLIDLTEYATAVGIEGAKIGVKGAALGISAIGKVFKLLDANYDTEDLEREVEREAYQIERQAAKLERRAEEVEWMADELEDLFAEMEREFVELKDLHWDH